MEFGPQQIGKWLMLTGFLIALAGAMIIIFGRAGLTKLPGDVVINGKNWRIYLPVASSILLSVVLTLVLWLINYFRR